LGLAEEATMRVFRWALTALVGGGVWSIGWRDARA